MKKIDVGQAVTMLANLGVIAGIILLAYEIHQNSDVLREQARSGIVTEIGSLNAALYENSGDIGSIVYRAAQGEPLTGEEEYRLSRFRAQNFLLWGSAFRSLQEGIIEERDFDTEAVSRTFHETIPGMPKQYERVKAGMDPEFVQWLEDEVVSR